MIYAYYKNNQIVTTGNKLQIARKTGISIKKLTNLKEIKDDETEHAKLLHCIYNIDNCLRNKNNRG